MPLQQWNTQLLKQQLNQATFLEKRLLDSYAEDFGHFHRQQPQAVFLPNSLDSIQQLLNFAHSHKLPLTIRGRGLSQGGQSLAVENGAVLSMEKWIAVLDQDEEGIWVQANASWSQVISESLATSRLPFVTPNNCHLSIAGTLSAGGIGAQSFKYGCTTDHVVALEVVTANGEVHELRPNHPLFHACLGGQGCFGVMIKIKIALRPAASQVRTFFLLYLDSATWLEDMKQLRGVVDYMECFCSPATQGAKLTEKGRFPFAQWLYCMQVSVEYDKIAPSFSDLSVRAHPWKLVHQQEEPLFNYLHRHDGRFQSMQATGLWALQHLWYECFVKEDWLFPQLENLLSSLPLHYAQTVHIMPLEKTKQTDFFAFPEGGALYSIMILNPGLAQSLVPSSLQAVVSLDQFFLKQGGKRYLSGFLGDDIRQDYWKKHFGANYAFWQKLKQQFDPSGVFCSLLHRC